LDALSHFRTALSLPGHANDIQINELEAHQLRKLGHFVAAEVAYERVIELARNLPSERDRDIVVARAKRYLAEIEDKPFNAYLRMRAGLEGSQHAPGPIVLFDRCQPLSSWEWVEKGDMHYFTALLARELNFHVVEGQSLRDADAAYEAALRAIRKKRWEIGKSTSRLRKRIRDGRLRITEARTQKRYDRAWLPRWSDQAQKPATEVGGSGGDQAIAQTA
jgi:hypothetical protein